MSCAGSPLHGAGTADFFGIPWLLYQDIAGNPRPGPDGTTDMGAYENWTDLQAVIDVVPGETLIPADGLSETMVTAVVLGENGNPVQNATVTWSVDVGTLVCCDSATNAVGKATATMRSASCHETATVSAQAQAVSAAGYAWVQVRIAPGPARFPHKREHG